MPFFWPFAVLSALGCFDLSCPLRLASAGGIDTSTVTEESVWYNPDEDWANVQNYISNWQGEQVLHVLDVFGASRGMERCFQKHGLKGAALDILLGGTLHDILSRDGWYNYLDHSLQLPFVCTAYFF